MRVGIVCPYSFDVPGGVQFHVRDLAEALICGGHHVSVLAPAEEETPLPSYVVGTGKTVAVRYNGSVARLAFGPITAVHPPAGTSRLTPRNNVARPIRTPTSCTRSDGSPFTFAPHRTATTRQKTVRRQRR